MFQKVDWRFWMPFSEFLQHKSPTYQSKSKATFSYSNNRKFPFFHYRILNSNGERPLTAYLIHSIPLQQSAVQLFVGDKMTVVAHLVGLEQLGYEKVLGMTMGVRSISDN